MNMTLKSKRLIFLAFMIGCLVFTNFCFADSGYELWLNYKPIRDKALKTHYEQYCSNILSGENKYADAIKHELDRSMNVMLSKKVNFTADNTIPYGIHIQLGEGYGMTRSELESLTDEGYSIRHVQDGKRQLIVVQSGSDAGLLYGVFHLIRLMQCGQRLDRLQISESPRHNLRLLNHWDDLNGDIERGYAGNSLWNWNDLPDKVDERYADYARANASIGINGIVINNVNADPRILRRDYLLKAAALADVLRKFHIRLYLSANFAAPLRPSDTPDTRKKWGGTGQLDTANPLDSAVILWWKQKVDEIYSLIPDFGGFLVKANSEGMPGPQDYGCSHADGANMLARALKPHNGVVMWRTFVYNAETDPDRAKRPYKEFVPLDGLFDDNVILQAKNGPLDFQPREPAQPLFGAMKQTPLMPELQITQEYIGQATYLVYLLPMWKEFFEFDTYCNGAGSTIAKLTGDVYPSCYRAIAGVANTGNNANWTGHHFAQANWYAFGRLAWDPDAEQITDEWIRMTWNCDKSAQRVVRQMMEPTWECFVAGSTPYAMGMTCSSEDHYKPGFRKRANKAWTVNRTGIGTDRSSTGSDYVSQYLPPNRDMYNDIARCPEKLLLHFHFVPWNHLMRSGKTLRTELFEGLRQNIRQVDKNILLWNSLKDKIDKQRFRDVAAKLLQEKTDAEAYFEDADTFFNNELQ
jgi:alpha-glucuronidase